MSVAHIICRSARDSAVSFLMFFIVGLPVCAEEGARELLNRAAENAGGRVVHTAEIYFDATIADAPPTKEQIQQRVDSHEKALRELRDEHRSTNPELSRRFDAALSDNYENVSRQVIANAKRSIRGVYLIGGPHFGGDRLAEFRIKKGSEPEWNEPVFLISRNVSDAQHISFFLDSRTKMAVASDKRVSIGVPEPHVLGRMQGAVLRHFYGLSEYGYETMTVNAKNDASPNFTVEYHDMTADTARGVGVNVLASVGERDPYRIAYIEIDEKRNFICPTIEEYAENGELICSWKSSDFFLDAASGVWFPAQCVYTYTLPGQSGEVGSIHYDIDPERSRFNAEIPLNRFSVSTPIGTTIVRKTSEVENKWTVDCELDVTIDGIDTLENDSCIKVATVSAIDASPPNIKLPQKSNLRLWIVVANIVVILGFGLFLVVRRIVKGQASKCILMALASSATVPGCAPVADEAAPSATEVPEIGNICVAIPSAVEMGTITALGQKIETSLAFRNRSDRDPIRVVLSSGCGCATFIDNHIVIRPQSTIHVPLSISTYGRRGKFETSVVAKWNGGGSKQSGTVIVPVRVQFIQSVFAMPNRVFLSESGRNGMAGELAITAPFDVWPTLEVVGSNTNIQVDELPSEKRNEGVRRFRIRSKSKYGSNGASVRVNLRGQSQPVMVVPILIGSDKSVSQEREPTTAPITGAAGTARASAATD